MTWPPSSPDLELTGMVWDELEHRGLEKQPTSAQHLYVLKTVGKTIPGDYHMKLIERMPRNCHQSKPWLL